ncbi:MAG: hypothetical protein AAFP86_17610 [Planctomycetota bacterium]
MTTSLIHILALVVGCGAPLLIVEWVDPEGWRAQSSFFLVLLVPGELMAAAWVEERRRGEARRSWLSIVGGTAGAFGVLGNTWLVGGWRVERVRADEWPLFAPTAALGVVWALDLLRRYVLDRGPGPSSPDADGLPLAAPARPWVGIGLLVLVSSLYAYRYRELVPWIPVGLGVGIALLFVGWRAGRTADEAAAAPVTERSQGAGAPPE